MPTDQLRYVVLSTRLRTTETWPGWMLYVRGISRRRQRDEHILLPCPKQMSLSVRLQAPAMKCLAAMNRLSTLIVVARQSIRLMLQLERSDTSRSLRSA